MNRTSSEIDLSVVMPCLNEEETIGESIRQAREAVSKLGLAAEILVVDSDSTDRSREIALREGARVINQPERGYGNAYLKGFDEARGRYLVMGDPDGTHDFREIIRFVDLLREGNDFVMGSRYRGTMMPGSMPLLNRHLGNPMIYKIMRLFFGTRVSDTNCGMRAITREAYRRLNLQTKDWEYALEMVVKAERLGLRTAEVPITYYARGGETKLRPMYAGWRNLRFMLLYCPNWLFMIPGIAMLAAGFGLMLLLLGGAVHIGGCFIGFHFSVLGALLSILGFQTIALGAYAKVYSVAENFGVDDAFTEFLNRYISLERGIVSGGIVFLAGLAINLYLVYRKLIDTANVETLGPAIFAMSLMILGAGVIFSSFFLSVLQIRKRG
jgi:glycosyltransferase involved in cell wall biosynthesis